MFAAPADLVAMGLSTADLKLTEVRYTQALEDLHGKGSAFPELNSEVLGRNYPGSGQCMTQVLHSADMRLSSMVKE